MSKQEHPYAQVLRWIAAGDAIEWHGFGSEKYFAVTEPNELLENIGGGHKGLVPPENFRLKPRTITINGIEVPEPMRVAPEEGSDYFIVNIEEGEVDSWRTQWDCGYRDCRRLKAGLCHATREAAEIHARALLSFTTQEAP